MCGLQDCARSRALFLQTHDTSVLPAPHRELQICNRRIPGGRRALWCANRTPRARV